MPEQELKTVNFGMLDTIDLGDINLDHIDPTDTLSVYMKQVSELGTPLLTFEEELELGRRIQKGITLKDPEKPKAFDNVVFTDEAREAFNILVSKNLRLVFSFARKYQHRGVELEDLIQYGNLRLMDAAIKYEPERNLRFSTNASWWIIQSLQRNIADKGNAMRLPVHFYDEVIRVKKTIGKLEQKLKRKPTFDDISKETGLTTEYINLLFNSSKIPISLDEPLESSDDENERIDFIVGSEDDFVSNIEEHITNQEFLDFLNKMVIDNKLNKRNLLILFFRTGFIDGDAHTLEDTGNKFDITRERIRQLEGETMEKIRKAFRIYLWQKKTLKDKEE
jgi:RNA polymerase sigma factor (sigma-70 family)